MVEFLYPYSFLLLIFLVLFFKKGVEFKINPKIIANKTTYKFKKYILALSYILLVIALTRPVTDKKEVSSNLNLQKTALALDISKSMLASDVYPNRLTFAKYKMKQFISKFNGEMAIMAFSDSAFLVSPYTSDKNTLKYLLNNINTSYITSSGTDFQNLINTAKNLAYTDLVVFSDGGDVKHLNTKGINLYVLLIGNKPTPIKLKNGNLLEKNGKVVLVDINRNILKYAKFGEIASTGDKDIDKLIKQGFKKVTQHKKIYVYKELFIYPLGLALLFLFMGFYSLPSKIDPKLPLILLFFTIHSKAGVLDWYYLNQAKQAYENKDYNKSAMIYKNYNNAYSKFNYADSLYKLKKYKEALQIYKTIKDKNLQEQIFYNMGNCYVKLNKIEEAIKSYREALKIDPKDKEAKYNLELLLKHKKKQKNHNKKSKNKNNQKNDKQKNSSKKQQQNNKQEENEKKQNNKQRKQQNQKHQNNSHKQQNRKKELNKRKISQQKKKENQKKEQVKTIRIQPSTNSDLFNKIKTQTLMVPLSKGESNNDW